jgi:hypothetical protein
MIEKAEKNMTDLNALAQFELEMLHLTQSNYLKKFKLHKSI